MKWVCLVLLAAAEGTSAGFMPPRIVATVKSPDGRTAIQLRRHWVSRERGYGPLLYGVTRDGKEVLGDSPLGLRRADQHFDAATITLVGGTDLRTIDERYTMPHGKAREYRVRARQRTLHFKTPEGARLDITLRAQNDGVAFRYEFPERDARAKTIVEEQTGFGVPGLSTLWILPRQPVGKYAPAYEDLYRQVPPDRASDLPAGWDLPALFKTPDGKWGLITESGLDGTYCGAHLSSRFRVTFPDPGEGRGVGNATPTSTLPWTLPWRVIIVGDRAGDIIESNLVTDVAPPSKIGPAPWVKPGRAAWSWWSMSDSPKHAEQLNAFTDLAAEMGWEYALVDANWNVMESGTIQDVLAHAKQKNVGLLFWYNSGGPHNDVTEAPRDRMSTHEQRVKEFAQLKAWGVKGVKVDFWQSDKQDRITQYRDLLKDAADFQLMVDFHGSTIPRGWQREFPNLIGMEAVAGAEQYKFREDYAAKAPWLNTVLPFTRNVAGPMDYTPVTFSDAKYPHQTTNAHELALSVIFESPIQHFADSVDSYRALPDPAKAFLKQVPADWDETRVLSGEPGGPLIIVRRDRGVWYVGGISGANAAVTVTVDLSFLREGQWSMRVIRDGSSDRELVAPQSDIPRTPADRISVPMRAHGGFVMRLERQEGRR
jgi:alpha-glucosidase